MYTKYKKSRNKSTHVKEISKENYYCNLFCENNDLSLTWKHIYEIINKSKQEASLPNFLKTKEKEITEPQNICNELNQPFVDTGKKITNTCNSNRDKCEYLRYLGKHRSSSVVFLPTDEYEIVGGIGKLNAKQSPGYIDIPVCVIKSSKYLIAGFSTRVFNKCLDCGNYPDIVTISSLLFKKCTVINTDGTFLAKYRYRYRRCF